MESDSTKSGDTIASFDSTETNDVTVLSSDEENDSYKVQMPDGSVMSMTDEGLESLRDYDWTDYPIDEDWTKKPWEPNPDPSPLDPEPSDPVGVVKHSQPHTSSELRYECPNCGGKFKSWHKERGGVTEDDTYHCPFCMKERGEFGPEDDEERIREIVEEAIEEANRNHHRLSSGI